jgi:hypothetical protein
MPVAQNFHCSRYGWKIILPSGWEPLTAPEGPSLSVHRPVVFCASDDFDLALTWMIAAHPMKPDVAQKFLETTAAQMPPDQDVQAIAPTIFPVIGTVQSSEVVQLQGGMRGLEVVESYRDEGEEQLMQGIQLIMPFSNSPNTFQRLCFYAPQSKFAKNLPAIREAMRSFHYS